MGGIVSVFPSVPAPARGGGALRSLRLLQALDQAFDVTAVVPVRHPSEARPLQELLRGTVVTACASTLPSVRAAARLALGAPVGYARYSGAHLRRALADAVRARCPDLVHFDHLHTAALVPVARATRGRATVVVDEHNVESMLLRRVAAAHPSAMVRGAYAWHASRVERLEALLVGAADAVLACSAEDASALRALGAIEVEVVPNGVDPASQPDAPGPRNDVVFIGAMDWEPNVHAAVELATRIWPAAASRLPGSRLVIVGRSPSRRVRSLAGPSVVVTGTVPDVRPWLSRALATAIPLRAGGGTRLKILEAAAWNVPIVATGLAVEGLPLDASRDYLRAERPDEFVDALALLRRDAALRAQLARSAAEKARAFEWRLIGARLRELYERWMGSTPGADRRCVA